MGELEQKLGRVLTVLFVNLWKHLDPNTQHWLEVVAIAVGAVSFTVAVVKDLSRIRIRKSSIAEAMAVIVRWLHVIVQRMNLLFVPAIGLLILAAFGAWPYNFYILTRIVVCLTSAWFAFQLHSKRRFLWEAPVIAVALIFNPVAPFHLDKETWRTLNILGAIVLSPALFIPVTRKPAIQLGEAALPQCAQNFCTHCGARLGASDCFCRHCGVAIVRQ
jgi:ribosomal protein L40E